MPERSTLAVDQILSAEPMISSWLWALEDSRKRTKTVIENILPASIDWLPDDTSLARNSIGSLLYHIALIEADWLYAEVLEQDYPASIMALFPHADRDSQGHLTHVPGVSLEEHLQRLDAVRAEVLRIFRSMSLADFRRIRHLPNYDVTPEWVIHHLLQHEAEHRSEIAALRHAAELAHK